MPVLNRVRSPIVALFLLALLIEGKPGVSAQAAGAKPSELCTVEGQVVKSTTGEGLRKITVQLQPMSGDQQQARSATTDAAGHFLISNVEPGRYAIAASGSGYAYVAQGYGQGRRARSRLLVLAPGQHEREIVIRLQPPGVITGTVGDEDGDPVVNVQVQALRLANQGQRRQVVGSAGAQTNDRGDYRIFGLEPGQYVIAVNRQQEQLSPLGTGEEARDEVYVPTFFPGTQDAAQATPVQVEPGDEVSGINVDLRPLHGVRMRGRVLSEGSATPSQGVYVSLTPRDLSFIGFPMSNYGTNVQERNGAFEIRGVPPGSYFLSANFNDGRRQYYGRTPVDVGNANLEGITVVMGGAIELRGRFRTDSDAKLDFKSLNLWLQPSENSPGGGGAEIRPDGTFVIKNLYDGNYRLHVGGFPEEYYIKSARLGGLDVLEGGVTISRSQVATQLEIVLTLDGGRVDGAVLKEQQPVGGALVVLVPDLSLRNHEELYSFKRSDSLGRFSMLGLPPGDFKLFAWETTEGVNYNDPDYIKLYEDRGTPVHIEEKRQQSVQLELISAEEEPAP